MNIFYSAVTEIISRFSNLELVVMNNEEDEEENEEVNDEVNEETVLKTKAEKKVNGVREPFENGFIKTYQTKLNKYHPCKRSMKKCCCLHMIALGQTLDLSLFSPSMFFRDNLLKFPDLNEGEDENGEDKNDSLIDDDEPSDAEIYEANTSEMKKKKKKMNLKSLNWPQKKLESSMMQHPNWMMIILIEP